MDKTGLLKSIISTLKILHKSAENAAQEAHHVATHEENIAENKFDTMGLEASYLAHGQQKRQAECEADLNCVKALQPTTFNAEMPITIGAVILLENLATETRQWVFLSPAAGGVQIQYNGETITLITRSSPLGQALIERHQGDDFELSIQDKKEVFEILSVL